MCKLGLRVLYKEKFTYMSSCTLYVLTNRNRLQGEVLTVPCRVGLSALSLTNVGSLIYRVRWCARYSGYVAESAITCLFTGSDENIQLKNKVAVINELCTTTIILFYHKAFRSDSSKTYYGLDQLKLTVTIKSIYYRLLITFNIYSKIM